MRIAVYFTPPADHPLVRTAASWLGRDAFSGARVRRGPVAGFDDAELDALTAVPRRYGFHATLKPPFRVAADHSLDEIRASLAAFCRDRASLTIPALRLAEIGPFFALTAGEAEDEIGAFADAVVRTFEPFRAPLTEAGMAPRRPERLTERQRGNLLDWGYPHVFEDFRFHMTLTGPVPAEHRIRMAWLLRERFASFIGKPLTIDALSLFRESAPPGDFVVDTVVALASAEQPVRAE
jgi:putative phosphonate metabolism protein